MDFIYIAGAASIAALVFAIAKYGAIMKADAGDSKMQEISKQVQDGAAAFLKAEYKWLTVFVAVVAVAIFFSDAEQGLGQKTAIAFVAGAAASAIAGYFGMHTATRSAVRTTQAARTGLAEALDVSFGSGVVMGMSVVGLALLGLVIFITLYAPELIPRASSTSSASASAPPPSRSSRASAAASSPRPPTSAPTSSARSRRASPRTTPATPAPSPTTSATTSATWPAWAPTCSSPTSARSSPP